MPNIKFPSIKDIASVIRGINTEESFPGECGEECYIDVRLQVYPDGQWSVHSGDSSYDQDHRGFWGSSCVPGNGKRFSSVETARELIDQAKDHHADSASDAE